MSSATNFGVTLTSDQLHPRNLFNFLFVITGRPRFHKSILSNEAQCNVGMATVIFHKCLHCATGRQFFRHMVIGRPNYSKSSCCNIILHCDAGTTSATANVTRCIKTTLSPTALKPEHKRSSK